MEREIPHGVKLVRVINLITIVLNVIFTIIIFSLLFIPRMINYSGKITNAIPVLILGLIAFALFCIPAILLSILNKALLNLKKKARTWQIVISFIFLFCFPVGTILHGIILYFMLFDKDTRESFGISNTATIK